MDVNEAIELKRDLEELESEIGELKSLIDRTYDISEPYTGPKVVVYASTKNRYDQMAFAAKTLIDNGNVDKIYFLTEDDEFPMALPEIITTVNVSEQNFFPSYKENANSPWTYMANMRLAFHRMFPQYDRMVWLDIDTLVVDDISEMFNAPLGDYYYFAAVRENRHYRETMRVRKVDRNYSSYSTVVTQPNVYFNSGVLVVNTKLLRKDGMGDRLIRKINNHLMMFPDQNAINILCRGRIFELSHQYNWSFFTDDTLPPKIIHTSHGPYIDEVNELIEHYNKVSFEELMEQNAKKDFVVSL